MVRGDRVTRVSRRGRSVKRERERGEVDRLRRERIGRVGSKSRSGRRRIPRRCEGAKELEDVMVEEVERVEPESQDVRLRSEDEEDDESS